MKEKWDERLTLHAVCSEDGEDVACRRRGWIPHFHPNRPLSYKHDFVVQALEDWNVDAVCIVNSDDLFTLEYLDVVRDALNDGADMVRFYSYVFVDTIEHRATFAPKAYPASGVVMTSALLDALEWKPWAGKPINRYLDTRLGENLDEVGAEGVALLPSYEDPAQLCSLKSEHNMWAYEEHVEMCDGPRIELNLPEYMERHFPQVAAEMRLPPYASIQPKE
jgi:hypothetical protein